MRPAGEGADVSTMRPSRSSCPVLHMRSASDGNGNQVEIVTKTGTLRDQALRPYVDWFKDHIEIVGAPRPETTHRQEGDVSQGSRQDALKQVSLMADRYRAQLEQQKAELMIRRKARSSPDLTGLAEASLSGLSNPTTPRTKRRPHCKVDPSRYSDYPRCMSACMTLQFLEDVVRQIFSRHASDHASGDSASPENAVIIFDWDDTLLPTTHILQTVLPSLPPQDREGPIPRGTPFYDELAAHAHIVGFVLRVARRAGRVAIITNSLSPWVIASASRYLPGLEIEALLEDLEIPVYYARRHVAELTKNTTYEQMNFSIEIDHSSKARIGLDIVQGERSLRIARVDDTGLVSKWNEANPSNQVCAGDWIMAVNGNSDKLAEECRKPKVLKIDLMREVPKRDPYMEAKRIDMATCLKRFTSKPGFRQNVLSIGDSLAEQQAIKEALPRSGRPSTDPLCKTVNLLWRPTLHQLSNELRILMVWLSYMVKYDKDFDIAMNKLDTLEKELFRNKG